VCRTVFNFLKYTVVSSKPSFLLCALTNIRGMGHCKHNGCRKIARSTSHYCSKHTTAEELRIGKTTTITAARPKPEKKYGYLGQFIFDDNNEIRRITELVEKQTNDMNKDTGCRSFCNLRECKTIEPSLNLVVEQAKVKISFPLKKNTRNQEIIVVLAPGVNLRSNWWTKGLIHRDFASTEVTGVYTIMFCVDRVTEENGAVQIWQQSKNCVHDTKNPTTATKDMTATTLAGPKNSVFIWDSRLLHRSLPNKTSKSRRVLIWMVSSKSKPGVSISS
jgi:hypothetical protein